MLPQPYFTSVKSAWSRPRLFDTVATIGLIPVSFGIYRIDDLHRQLNVLQFAVVVYSRFFVDCRTWSRVWGIFLVSWGPVLTVALVALSIPFEPILYTKAVTLACGNVAAIVGKSTACPPPNASKELDTREISVIFSLMIIGLLHSTTRRSRGWKASVLAKCYALIAPFPAAASVLYEGSTAALVRVVVVYWLVYVAIGFLVGELVITSWRDGLVGFKQAFLALGSLISIALPLLWANGTLEEPGFANFLALFTILVGMSALAQPPPLQSRQEAASPVVEGGQGYISFREAFLSTMPWSSTSHLD